MFNKPINLLHIVTMRHIISPLFLKMFYRRWSHLWFNKSFFNCVSQNIQNCNCVACRSNSRI